MDEEVQHNILNAMEILDQDLSQRDSKTDQRRLNLGDCLSDVATDPPMNHGDGIDQLLALPGPSFKAQTQVKRTRKKADPSILAILRENLHRESKSIAKEKIRNLISQHHTIVKKSRKRLGSRVYRKRFMPKKKKVIGRKLAPEKKRNKVRQERMLRLSPVFSNSDSSVSERLVSGKSSKESCESGSSGSETSASGTS